MLVALGALALHFLLGEPVAAARRARRRALPRRSLLNLLADAARSTRSAASCSRPPERRERAREVRAPWLARTASARLAPLPAARPARRRARTGSRRSSRCRVGDPRRRRARRLRGSLLPALVAAGALRRRSTCAPRRTTSCARSASRRRAGRSSTARAACSSTNVPGTAVKLWSADLPKRGRATAMIKRLADGPRTSRSPRIARGGRRARSATRSTPITVKTAVHEDQVAYLLRARSASSRASQIAADLPAQLPAPGRSPRRSSATSARSRRSELERAAQARATAAGDKIGKAGVEATYDRVPARARRAPRRSASTRSAGRRARSSRGARRAPGNAVRLTIDVDAPARGRAGAPLRDRDSRTANEHVLRERRRDRRARPARRRDPRDGLVPDVQAVGLRRPGRPEEARAARRRRRRRRSANYPGLNRAIAGRVPARLDLQARDRARGDAGAPALAVRVDPVHADRRRTASTSRSFKNWDPYVNRADDAAEALARVVRHVLLRRRLPLLRLAGERRAHAAAGVGARVRLRRADRARPRRRGGRASCRRPRGASRRSQTDWRSRPGTRATRSSSRSARRTCSVTPLQMARFYAMIANGGKLVTPYVVADVEQPGAERRSRRSSCSRFAPDPPQPVGRRPGRARRSSATGSTRRRTRTLRHVVRRLRQLPDPDRRQDGHGGEGRRAPGLPGRTPRGPVVVVRLRARRDERRARRLRA